MPILADASGLVVIAGQLIVVFRWLCLTTVPRLIAGIFAYAILAAGALALWLGRQSSEMVKGGNAVLVESAQSRRANGSGKRLTTKSQS